MSERLQPVQRLGVARLRGVPAQILHRRRPGNLQCPRQFIGTLEQIRRGQGLGMVAIPSARSSSACRRVPGSSHQTRRKWLSENWYPPTRVSVSFGGWPKSLGRMTTSQLPSRLGRWPGNITSHDASRRGGRGTHGLDGGLGGVDLHLGKAPAEQRGPEPVITVAMSDIDRCRTLAGAFDPITDPRGALDCERRVDHDRVSGTGAEVVATGDHSMGAPSGRVPVVGICSDTKASYDSMCQPAASPVYQGRYRAPRSARGSTCTIRAVEVLPDRAQPCGA